MYRSLISLMPKAAGFDADAQAFITAAGITDATQKSAINTLVLDLKGYSIWTKMQALYPFVGGTASTHKFNLKNPLDTNAAFRLVFNGGWTHSANGAQPNGTNGFAETYLNNNTLAQNNNHISGYSRTNNGSISTLISSWNSGFGTAIYPVAVGFFYANNNGNSITTANTDSRGFYLNTRRNSTQILLQKNSTQSTISNNSTSYITTTFKIGQTGNSNSEFSNRQLAFISAGDGLSDTEAANFYTAVQAFQTTLSRNV